MVSVVSPVSTGIEVSPEPVIVPVQAMPEPGLRQVMRDLPASVRRIWPAWAMLLLSVACSFGILLLLAVLWRAEGTLIPEMMVFITAGPPFCLMLGAGILILHRYPGHRVGWVLCLAGTVWITTTASYLYGMIAIEHPGVGLEAGVKVLQAGFFYPFGLYLMLVELLLIFPNGRLAARGWSLVRGLGFAGALGASLMIGFGHPHAMMGEFGEVRNPWYVSDALGIGGFGFLVIFAMGVPAGISMVRRLRRASGIERAQMRWIAWDIVIVLIAFTVHASGVAVEVGGAWPWVVGAVWNLALASIGVVVGLAILRYRLYDIDIVIRRSVLYAFLVAGIAALYLGLVAALNGIARAIDADRPNPWFASVIVAAGVALVAHPMRRWLEAQVNRRLYGDRENPGEALARLGARLEGALAPAELLGEVTETVTDLLRVPHAAVALRAGGGLEVVAESGMPGARQVGIPMVYRDEAVGELRVTPRGPDDGFSPADTEVLHGVARQTAVAAYALRVTADLQQARERLVSAREEERRRLRRDLHDGLGAQLAALTMQANGLRRMIHADPDRAGREVELIQDELRSAIADIRRLVHGLRPPALDEFGLVHALRGRLVAFESASNGTVTALHAEGDDRALPAAIEVAVFRIVEEALTNVSRHADARRVEVFLRIGDAVVLEIVDDGRGMEGTRDPGVGIHSMRERTEELGGSFSIGSGPQRGARVTVTIPLPGEDV
jgi:signal transduction histidine kinase